MNTIDDYQLSMKTTFEDTRRISHTMTINYPRKRPEIMKMMVSWNRTERDFEEESLFEDNVCYILYLIVGVL